MTSKYVHKANEPRNKTVFLRITERQYNYLKALSDERGENIQAVLKSAFFSSNIDRRPLMHIDCARDVIRELTRIGVNVNQIAKVLNSGFRAEWYDYFETCAHDISEIKSLLCSHLESY